MSATAADGAQFINQGTSASASFGLNGGTYSFSASSTNWASGTLSLNQLSLDGVTQVPVTTATANKGPTIFQLPASQYQLANTSALSVYASISRIRNV
jgi:hypothetical protein